MVQDSIIEKEITITNAQILVHTGGIFHIIWKPEMDITIPDIDELSACYEEVSQGKKMKIIQELNHFTSITTEARKYAAKNSPDVIAIAYVIKGLGQRLIIRFYLNIRRAKNPAKVFMNVEDAQNWLESF